MVGILFSECRKDMAFLRNVCELDSLVPKKGFRSEQKRRYDSKDKRSFILGLFVIYGGEKPEFPVRAGEYDMSAVYRPEDRTLDEWTMEVGWVNFCDISVDDCIRAMYVNVLENQLQGRDFKGLVVGFKDFSQVPRDFRSRLEYEIDQVDVGAIMHYPTRQKGDSGLYIVDVGLLAHDEG